MNAVIVNRPDVRGEEFGNIHREGEDLTFTFQSGAKYEPKKFDADGVRESIHDGHGDSIDDVLVEVATSTQVRFWYNKEVIILEKVDALSILP